MKSKQEFIDVRALYQDKDGHWHIVPRLQALSWAMSGTVRSDVRYVEGSFWGDVWSDVTGIITGRKWKFVKENNDE